MMNKFLSLNTLMLTIASLVITGFSGCGEDKTSLGSNENCTEAGYCLVWEDEFSGFKLDASKWSFERNCWGGGNNEAQCYVDDSQNIWLDGELLHIKAIREDLTGPNAGDDEAAYDANDQSGTGTYSSARIRTKNKGDWRYGRFEIRAKLPYGQGSWPAIWMLPTDWVFGGWAASGEIDIMEAVNLKVAGERQIHGTLHYGATFPNNVYTGEPYLLPNQANPADDFHIYALEWEKGEIRWYVDGDHYATQTEAGWYSTAALGESAAPFNQRFHMILNLAVGGAWAANTNDGGIDESAFPQELVVDYVRVYECSHDPEHGKGCATSDGDFVKNPGVQPPVEVSAGEDFVVFDGAVTAPFAWHTWTAEGDIEYSLVDAGVTGYVAQISYLTDEGVGYFQSTTTSNFSAYQNIEFDLRVISDTRANKGVIEFRADCIYPCTSGSYSIGYPQINTWNHYRISMSALIAAGLNANAVDTPFVIAPQVGNQRGLVLQVDNVTLTR